MLGGWESGLLTLQNQGVGYVCKEFVLCKNVNENNRPLHIQHFLIDRELSLYKLTWPGAKP